MKGALIILLVTVFTGALLFLWHTLTNKPGEEGAEDATLQGEEENEDDVCCGQHAVCEKERRLTDEIVYYDDEELDDFKGRKEDEYSDEEIEQFRDILYTLNHDDMGGWARSMELREITLPTAIREELISMMAG